MWYIPFMTNLIFLSTWEIIRLFNHLFCPLIWLHRSHRFFILTLKQELTTRIMMLTWKHTQSIWKITKASLINIKVWNYCTDGFVWPKLSDLFDPHDPIRVIIPHNCFNLSLSRWSEK
jgi:hypothetical protein